MDPQGLREVVDPLIGGDHTALRKISGRTNRLQRIARIGKYTVDEPLRPDAREIEVGFVLQNGIRMRDATRETIATATENHAEPAGRKPKLIDRGVGELAGEAASRVAPGKWNVSGKAIRACQSISSGTSLIEPSEPATVLLRNFDVPTNIEFLLVIGEQDETRRIRGSIIHTIDYEKVSRRSVSAL